MFRKKYIVILLFLFFNSITSFAQRPSFGNFQTGASVFGQSTQQQTKTNQPVKPRKTIKSVKRDTLSSVIPDSLRSKQSQLETTVNYTADDSTVLEVGGKVLHLYGNAQVSYGVIDLQADYIRLDWGKNEVYAHGMPDTTKKVGEKVKGKPVFTQSGESYNTDTIRYNFKSKKAIIKQIITQQGEGIIHGQKVKKDSVNNLYLINAMYTTCNLAHPHFHIESKKIKLVDKKQVISGPFHFELNDVPLPIGLPFGFFPVPKKKEIGTSGFVMGTYGEEPNGRGFYFRDFGYYHAFNEYVGAKALFQVYSKGSYGAAIQSTYTKKYKYNGSLNFQFNHNVSGSEALTAAQKKATAKNDFNIAWSHTPQTRRTDRSFSAQVNLVSNGFNKNNKPLDQLYGNAYTNNAFGSSVQGSRNFGKLIRTSTSVRVDQNVSTKIWNGSWNYSFGISQVNPFVPEKKQIGKWYESFRVGLDVSGSATATNDITYETRTTTYAPYKIYGVEQKALTDAEIKSQSLGLATYTKTEKDIFKAVEKTGQFRNSFSMPITLPNFKVAKFINLTPSVSLRGDIYTKQLSYKFYNKNGIYGNDTLKNIDPTIGAVKIDTLNGFYAAVNPSFGFSMNTRLYNTKQFNGTGRLKALRHILAPSASYSFVPNLNDMYFQTMDSVRVGDKTKTYLPKYIGQSASPGKVNNISWSLSYQLEAKVRAKSDTAKKEFEKISIIDNLSMSGSYNMTPGALFALSIPSISMNNNILKGLINTNFNASFDPYKYVQSSVSPAGIRVDTLKKWKDISLSNMNISIGTRLSPATFNKDKAKAQQNSQDPTKDAMQKFIQSNPNAYVDFNIPWSMNISYGLNYSKIGFADKNVTQTLTFQGDLSLTPKWKFTYNTGWDFRFKTVTLTTIGIMRELHCWDMSFNWTPISGNSYRASNFSFDLRPRSSLLRDLRLSRRRMYYDRGGF